MHSRKVTINARDWQTVQFDTIDEALEHIPPSMLLQYVNQCWHNLQVAKLVDALREVRREKK